MVIAWELMPAKPVPEVMFVPEANAGFLALLVRCCAVRVLAGSVSFQRVT